MARYIDADKLNLDEEVELADDWKTAHEIANIVKYAPTEDVAPVIHAEWMLNEEGEFYCLNCGAVVFPDSWYWHRFLYCYHCGAKMEQNDRHKRRNKK